MHSEDHQKEGVSEWLLSLPPPIKISAGALAQTGLASKARVCSFNAHHLH